MIQKKTIFHESWWLDSTAGKGKWGETNISIKNITVKWRYEIKKLLGKKLLVQPQLTPFLGPWFEVNSKSEISYSDYDSAIIEIIKKLPRNIIISQSFGREFNDGYPLYWSNLSFKPRYTYLYKPEDKKQLVTNMHSGTRRDIKKAIKSEISIKTEDNFQVLDFLSNKSFSYQKIKRPYSKEFLKRIYEESIKREKGKLYIARNKSGKICSCAFIVSDNQSSYYLIGGIDKEQKDYEHSMKLILFEVIKESLNNNKTFDFEGSMNHSIEKFFRGFGGKRYQYLCVRQISNKYLKTIDLFRRNLY